MEDEEDVMGSPTVAQPVQPEEEQFEEERLHEGVTVSVDVDSSVENTAVANSEKGELATVEVADREIGLEVVEDLKAKSEEELKADMKEEVVVVEAFETMVVVEDVNRDNEVETVEELRESEGIEPVGRESEVQSVEESRESEGIELVGRENEVKSVKESKESEGLEPTGRENDVVNVEQSRDIEGIEAIDGENEVNIVEDTRESEGIEPIGSENKAQNVEELREEKDEFSKAYVSVGEETRENVGPEPIGCEDNSKDVEELGESEAVEPIGRESEVKVIEKAGEEKVEPLVGTVSEMEVMTDKGENVGNDVVMEEEQVKGEANKVKVYGVIIGEQGPPEEVKVDESMKVEKDEDMVGEKGEALLRGNEVEGDTISKAEDVQMVDANASEMNTDELVEEKAVNYEQNKVLESEKKEGTDYSPVVTRNDELVVEEGTPVGENETGMEVDVKSGGGDGDGGSGSGGKGKRGRMTKAGTAVKVPPKKLVGEDVCFICLDGGDLVLCDRRGCPKAYHPTCVDHDAEFFLTKGRWNCGWHQCNQCGKNANFMCYTCQFSLCKACCKDAVIFCVRGNKGFCESCMKTITVIENSEQNETGKDAFTDKSSWEYLFKEYWLEQKENLSITFEELSQAKNPWKFSDKHQPSVEAHEGNDDAGSDSDISPGNSELGGSEKNVSSGKRKSKRKLKSQAKKIDSDSEHSSPDTSSGKGKKAKKLAKSRSKGVKYGAEGNGQWASKELLDLVMHMKGSTSVLTQFDVQTLLLEYIRKNKLRDPRRQTHIICDSMLQKLFAKPRVGHFEMLKLIESHFYLKDGDDNQGKVPDSEMKQLDADDNTDSLNDGGKSRGKKSRKRDERGYQSNLDDYAAIDIHNINLIFLRRNLMEGLLENPETFHSKAVGAFVRIRISGSKDKQDIYRLVQIIGTSKAAEPYKVGKRTTDIMLEILNLDKKETVSIDTMSNQEFSEDECKRLRQSIKCGLINRMTVGDILEKAKELQEVRVVDWLEAEIVRISHLRDRASEKGRKKELRVSVEKLQLLKTPEERQRRLDEIPEVHSDPKMDPTYESEDEVQTTAEANDTRPRETGFSSRSRDNSSSRKGASASSDSWSANARPLSRNLSGKGFSSRKEDSIFTSPTHDRSWSNGEDTRTPRVNSREKPGLTSDFTMRAEHSGTRSDISITAVSESSRISNVAGQADLNFSDTEKMWNYRDPAGKIQGPFSMSQLRKWSNTGYFPTDLRVRIISQTENDSILLTDILTGKVKEVPSVNHVPSPVNISKLSGNSPNLPSPTPGRNSFQSSNQLRGGIERLPSPTPTSPNPIGNSQHSFSASTLGSANGQQMELQSNTPNSMINHSNLAQIISNVIQPGTGRNPSAYTHGWTQNNPNTIPAQVGYNQWATPGVVSNQVPSYGAGYTNIAQNAWRPPPSTNMPWNGQQQQIMNQNMVWADQPQPMGQQAVNPGWSSAVPNQSAGTVNPGWVAPPGNPTGWGGDQSHQSGGSQRNR